MSSRRGFLYLLAFGAAFAFLDQQDEGAIIAPPDDGNNDTMTLSKTQLSDVQEQSGETSIGPGSTVPISIGSAGTEYELLGAVITRSEGDDVGDAALLDTVKVFDGSSNVYEVITTSSKDVVIPFGISGVNEIWISADSSNGSTWTWWYSTLYR
jgi:hypothetical protein